MKKMFILYLFCVPFLTLAQEAEVGLIDTLQSSKKDTTYWNSGLSIGLNFNQASFSGNWKAGGVNSIALGSIINGKANGLGTISWN